jgi:hypothetical protein
MIGSDTVVGSEEGDCNCDCLFKFADFNGDGFDDLAVRCLAIGEQGKILEDTMTIYTVQHGRPQVTIVKDPRQLARVCEVALFFRSPHWSGLGQLSSPRLGCRCGVA